MTSPIIGYQGCYHVQNPKVAQNPTSNFMQDFGNELEVALLDTKCAYIKDKLVNDKTLSHQQKEILAKMYNAANIEYYQTRQKYGIL